MVTSHFEVQHRKIQRHLANHLQARPGLLAKLFLWLAFLAAVPNAAAQLPDVTGSQKSEPDVNGSNATTLLPHFVDERFWLSGQMNFIYQTHPPFDAKYSGEHSFHPDYEKVSGRVLTLYTGLRLQTSGEVLLDLEEAEGLGLSSAFGIAGFTNLDAVRDPTLGATPYLSRIMYHRVIALGRDKTESTRGPLSVLSELPSRRLELRVGKFGITDFFDTNTVGGDSHLQFMNWALDQNGAYDFTADSRGYTWGVLCEYQSPAWGARFAEALMPGPNNGGPLVWSLRKANTSNLEIERHRGFLRKKDGIVRLLAFLNHANMGNYAYANQQYISGKVARPDLANHPLQVTSKYGFGINFEQSLTPTITAYGRFGWNNGKTETWSFTEIDQTFSGGIGFLGPLWKRRNDRSGIAFASNGISSAHATYLALGSLGSVLGDSALKYGRENLLETYYTAHAWRGIYLGPDLQYIVNPGYNRDRGPVLVPSFRLHLEL